MNSPFAECKRCQWEYMQEMSFVRRQPWTDDDAGMMFQSCQRCGRISIQHFDNDGGVSGVWILHPDSEVMFRAGTAPSHVFDYVFSDDFLKNRGITRGLFRGHLKSMLDLSGAVNVLVSYIKKSEALERVELCMELFRDLLSEYHVRMRDGEEDRRLAVSSLLPVAALVQNTRTLTGNGTNSRVEMRMTALEVLETFLQPALGPSVPNTELEALETAIDHMTMVEASIARMTYLAQGVDADALVEAYVESRFMYRVFRRRKARLSKLHAEAVWRLMHAVNQTYTLGSPLEFATKAYESLRGLMEHQLLERGFLKLGPRDRNGTACLAFRSTKGQTLLLPLWYPRLAIYATDDAERPISVTDVWSTAMDQL